MNTYSLNALRRFANIVNTALVMPIPSATEDALAKTLKHLEAGQAASDAARILLANVSAQSDHDIEQPASVADSIIANKTVSVHSEEPLLASIIDHPVVTPPPTPIDSVAVIDEPLNTFINETMSEPLEQPEQLRELVTDIQIDTTPSPSVLETIKKIDRDVLSAPAFFQMLPWRIVNTDTAAQENLEYERFLTKSLNIQDTLSATRFFQSLCWSSKSAQFSIGAGVGASGGSITPTAILATNTHTTLSMQQFFSHLPWTGKQSA